MISPQEIHINLLWESKPWEFMSPIISFEWYALFYVFVNTVLLYWLYVYVIMKIMMRCSSLFHSGYIGVCLVLPSKATRYNTSHGTPPLQATSSRHCKYFCTLFYFFLSPLHMILIMFLYLIFCLRMPSLQLPAIPATTRKILL